MGMTLGVDYVIQAKRLLNTSSQGGLFLTQMSIQTGTIVMDNIYTGKSVTIMILKHPTNGMNINRVTILWDFPVRTDNKTIQANRPNIVIKHQQNKMCQMIDMSVPSDCNISAKEFEKLSKYKDLEIESAKMWKYVNEIPGNCLLLKFKKLCLKNYFTPKLFLHLNKFYKFYTNLFIQLCTKFFIYNTYNYLHNPNSPQ